MDYPAWAPKSLCEYHGQIMNPEAGRGRLRQFREKRHGDADVTVLKKLIFRPEMEEVWASIREEVGNRPQNQLAVRFKIGFSEGLLQAQELYSTALRASRGPNRWDETPGGELSKEVAANAKSLRRISRNLRGTPADLNVLHLLADEIVEVVCGLPKWEGADPPQTRLPIEVILLDELMASSILEAVAGKIEARHKLHAERRIWHRHPSNLQRARQNYFVRKMLIHMQRYYREPLCEAVTTLATVVLDAEISSDKVTEIWRYIDPSKPVWR
jgi:hypothetical protein